MPSAAGIGWYTFVYTPGQVKGPLTYGPYEGGAVFLWGSRGVHPEDYYGEGACRPK